MIGHTPQEEQLMLQECGVASFAELLPAIPEELRLKEPLDLPPAQAECELRRSFSELAERNYDPERTISFLGGGIYDHVSPAAVDHIALRSEFYTAYTPYQPEVSQGTLAVIFEFQTMIGELTGMEVANASMYDGASAAGEACLMARGATRAPRILVAPGVNPRVQAVMQTYLGGLGLELEMLPERDGRLDLSGLAAALATGGDVAALVVQQPNFFGLLEPLAEIRAGLDEGRAKGPQLIVSADPLSLGLLASPGSQGADTVVGDLQSLGIPAQCGGPSGAYFATREKNIRRMPGRLAAMTRDPDGRRGFVLTLQTREQHIRREKATSNICTNSALLALRATVFLSLLGPHGLRGAAEQSLQRSHFALGRLCRIPGVKRAYPGPFFREFVIELPQNAAELAARISREHGILPGIALGRWWPERERQLLVAVTEKRTGADIAALEHALRMEIEG